MRFRNCDYAPKVFQAVVLRIRGYLARRRFQVNPGVPRETSVSRDTFIRQYCNIVSTAVVIRKTRVGIELDSPTMDRTDRSIRTSSGIRLIFRHYSYSSYCYSSTVHVETNHQTPVNIQYVIYGITPKTRLHFTVHLTRFDQRVGLPLLLVRSFSRDDSIVKK